MNYNRTPDEWSKVNPDAVVRGSDIQARNVLEMALQDIARMSMEIKRLKNERRPASTVSRPVSGGEA